MKKTLLSIAILAVAPTAMACMPPPPGMPAFYLQQPFISDLVQSEAVKQAILSQGENVTIKAIVPDGKYQVILSNNCKIKVIRDDSNASVGTCPDLLPLVIEKISCKK